MQIPGMNISNAAETLSIITGKENADEVFFDMNTVPVKNSDYTETGYYKHINETTQKTICINKNNYLIQVCKYVRH